MVAYIQEIAKDLIRRLQFRQLADLQTVEPHILVLKEELDRLDPRDFVPGSRYEFVDVRLEVRLLASGPIDRWISYAHAIQQVEKQAQDLDAELKKCHAATQQKEIETRLSEAAKARLSYMDSFRTAIGICQRVERVLNDYGGQGEKAVSRSFAFVQNAELRAIIERDYRELSQILMPSFAWKSAVVTAGSILEAVLHDLLTRDAARVMQATGS